MKDTFAKEKKFLCVCFPPTSFYRLIGSVWKSKHNPPNPLHRILTLMRKMKVRSLLTEELELNQELIDERDMAISRCKGSVEIDATRLTFFCSMPSNKDWSDESSLPENHILGYAVIVNLKLPDNSIRSYVLDAAVRTPSVVYLQDNNSVLIEDITNYYVHNKQTFITTIGTKEGSRNFPIEGTYFTQQNDLTSVCAHASPSIALNNSNLLQGSKLTTKRINDILGKNFSGPKETVGHYSSDKNFPKGSYEAGLSKDELEVVIRAVGGVVHYANFENSTIEYDRYLYPFIESGFPVILGLQSRNSTHVVSVLGHTLNTDRWSPEAQPAYGNYPYVQYMPVTEWIDHLIISDDNFGMHSTLPVDSVRNFVIPTKNPNLHASMVIAITDNDIIPGYFAEQVAVKVGQNLINSTKIKRRNYWRNRLITHQRKWVCRTIYQKKGEYINHLEKLHDTKQIKLNPFLRVLLKSLPTHLWVSEISLPNIYTGNKNKLGDVVIDAKPSSQAGVINTVFALAWFPGFIRFGKTNHTFPWEQKRHVSIIRKPTKDPVLEW